MLLRPAMGREGTSGFFQRTFDSVEVGRWEADIGVRRECRLIYFPLSSLLAPPLWVGGRERLQGRLALGLAL